MKVLVLNSGSSSIKFQLFRRDDWSVLASGSATRIGEPESLMRCAWGDTKGVRQRLEERVAMPDHQQGL